MSVGKLPHVVRAIVIFLGAAFISACGSDDPADSSPTPPPVGALSGVLTDAPVGGISFTASAGPSDPTVITGVTTSAGGFTFDSGDTITFSAGDIKIAELPAQETITPREIAADIVLEIEAGGVVAPDVEDVVTNLFVFFQSLDTDQDPNTITVPELGAVNFSGLTGIDVTDPTVLFTSSPTEFAADLEMVFAEIVETIPTLEQVIEVVNVEEALQHAAEQSKLLLAGTWRFRSNRTNGDPINLAITFFPNDTYLKGGLENDPNCNEPGSDPDGNGAEFGTYDWNPLTGEFSTGAPAVNTDGSCGLANIPADGNTALQVLGNELRLYGIGDNQQECTDFGGSFEPYIDGRDACVFAFTRAANDPTTIVGSFTSVADQVNGTPFILTIEADGSGFRYINVNASDGDNDPAGDNESDGAELGSFTIGADNVFQLGVITLDTTESGGLSPADNGTVRMFVDSATGELVITEQVGGQITENRLARLPLLPRIAAQQLYGSWVVVEPLFNDEPLTTAPHDRANLKVITFFKNGDYLYGTQYNEPGCENDQAYTRAGGNGNEFGKWAINAITGELVGTIPPATASKAYADTNGFCGLHEEPRPTQTDVTNDVFFARIVTPDLITFLGINPSAFPDGIPATVLAYDSQDDIPLAQQNDVYIFFMQRLPDAMGDTSSRAGAWIFDGDAATSTGPVLSRDANPIVFSFFQDNSFFLMHTGRPNCRGIERGLFNVTNGRFATTITSYANAIDTLFDCGMLEHSGHPDDLPPSDGAGDYIGPSATAPDEFRFKGDGDVGFAVLTRPAEDPKPAFGRKLPVAMIVVDGGVTDWSGVSPIMTDASGDQNGNTSTDLTALYVAVSGSTLAFRMDTAGPMAFPHTPSQDFSNIEVGIHFYTNASCDGGNDFYILNNFTSKSGQNTHQLDDYIGTGGPYPTTTAAGGQSLESSFALTQLPAGYTFFAFNPYIQSFLNPPSPQTATLHDNGGDLSECYEIPAST